MLTFPSSLLTFLLYCRLKFLPRPASNLLYAGACSQSCILLLPPCDSWAPFTWIPSENLIITDHQLVTSLLLILPRHVRCQYVSHLGPSTFPLVAKCLGFLTWICFSDAALASTPCMDEFCKRAAAQGGSDQLGGDGNSLSWLCCCWKSILQLLSQKTVYKIKYCYWQPSCRKLFFFGTSACIALYRLETGTCTKSLAVSSGWINFEYF